MTRPPEYDQVARWLRAISGDPALLEDIKASYSDINPRTWGYGSLEEIAEHDRQRLADEAREALQGIGLDGKSLDEVAEAYHQNQVSEYAQRRRALREEIRELTNGDFEVPSWCVHRAARDGIDLEVVIENYQEGALFDAHVDLGLLPRSYAVTEDEVEAYWAAESRAAAQHVVSYTRTEAAQLAGASFPRAVHLGPSRPAEHETSRQSPRPGLRSARGRGR